MSAEDYAIRPGYAEFEPLLYRREIITKQVAMRKEQQTIEQIEQQTAEEQAILQNEKFKQENSTEYVLFGEKVQDEESKEISKNYVSGSRANILYERFKRSLTNKRYGDVDFGLSKANDWLSQINYVKKLAERLERSSLDEIIMCVSEEQDTCKAEYKTRESKMQFYDSLVLIPLIGLFPKAYNNHRRIKGYAKEDLLNLFKRQIIRGHDVYDAYELCEEAVKEEAKYWINAARTSK